MSKEANQPDPDWIVALDKPPRDRTRNDLYVIFLRLQKLEAFTNLPSSLFLQICQCAFYEALDEEVVLFRQGDHGCNWYFVLSGKLECTTTEIKNRKKTFHCKVLSGGANLGQCLLDHRAHSVTVVTKEWCELLRIEKRDLTRLWEVNRPGLEKLLSFRSAEVLQNNGPHAIWKKSQDRQKLNVSDQRSRSPSPQRKSPTAWKPSEKKRLSPSPSIKMSIKKLHHAGFVLRTLILDRSPSLIRDHKVGSRTYRRCMVGSEMVDWILQQSPPSIIKCRLHVVGMWQALLEENALSHVGRELPFADNHQLYRFQEDHLGLESQPNPVEVQRAEEDWIDTLNFLTKICSDALMRLILKKPPHDRDVEELEIIYEELLHIKALAHLSTMVKRELAKVLIIETIEKEGTTRESRMRELPNAAWFSKALYVKLTYNAKKEDRDPLLIDDNWGCHLSVTFCTASSIVFGDEVAIKALRVKENVLFHQGDEGYSWYIILRGSVNVIKYGQGVVCVLNEGDDFGKLALVNDAPRAATIVVREENCQFLRVDKQDFNRILKNVEANTVRLKEHGKDVLVLQTVFLNKRTSSPTGNSTVQSTSKTSVNADEDFVIAKKKKVASFVDFWNVVANSSFSESGSVRDFLETLTLDAQEDTRTNPELQESLTKIQRLVEKLRRDEEYKQIHTWEVQKQGLSEFRRPSSDATGSKQRIPIRIHDDAIFRVFCADHTYTTLRTSVTTSVKQIINSVSEKMCLGGHDLVLCEVKSCGERVTFRSDDICITSRLSCNGQIFISPREHLDALTPLPSQDGPEEGTIAILETLDSREFAHQLTLYDFELFKCIHEYELIYSNFGRHNFPGCITANLDLFIRRFNEIQYWVATEILLAINMHKRVQLLKKLLKVALYCRDLQNINAFFAIMMGIGNTAVSRLAQTWEKLPAKFKRLHTELESHMDPTRNHRTYRLWVAKLSPPMIPFMPLLLKDLTFIHDGNKNYFDGLVNFEKMHLIASSIRLMKFSRSEPYSPDSGALVKNIQEIKQYVRNLHVIDNQKLLNQLSNRLEPPKTI
ncbi:Rap guanine nucleotide exchange factor 4 [Holothuria leucospilota]|uniref:Rap guanine nucleotide exchange factor 4 n=1 Tax=Holothuria leucospilota TaxID=206669 RepID=A0A9Q1BGN6_HOLLE|nr:Rap guanine nucleotide exchange factor 4 [Holothuria leucospilota]